MRPRALCALLTALSSTLLVTGCTSGDSGGRRDTPVPADAETFDAAAFAHPSAQYRPWIRWRWPGGAVDRAQLEVELDALSQAGFGGVEVQSFARQTPSLAACR